MRIRVYLDSQQMREPGTTTDNSLLRLRADVYPDLWELAQSIRNLLQQGVGAVVVENLPFAQLDLQNSKCALLALASCIGEPIDADPYRSSLVWPVSPRLELPPTYTPTITEHNDCAEIHTDSAFKIVPENYVLLYAHHPATDGGLSLLLSADRVLAKLAESESGRECVRILQSQDFPFRVPTVFTKHRSDAAVELINATILSERPRIRYRYDSIVSALRFLRTPLSSEAMWALAHFRHTLQHLSPGVLALKCGDLLVVNNYLVMHGRTAFEDRERMLLRIRLANTHDIVSGFERTLELGNIAELGRKPSITTVEIIACFADIRGFTKFVEDRNQRADI